MSSTDHADALDPGETPDDPDTVALERVRENRELFERIANEDLPISPVCQRALDRLDDHDGGTDHGR
jgi:hypothetical protein